MIPWIVTLILACAPAGYVVNPEVANAVDVAARYFAVFDGEGAYARTAALLVALSSREGHFDPDAVGRDAFGESYGLGQIHETNLPRLELTRADAFNPQVNLVAVTQLVGESFRACHRRPMDERLALYAGGRGRCDEPAAVRASVNRMKLAAWLLKAHPPFWTDESPWRIISKHGPARPWLTSWAQFHL
jgi:Transglycosylase SLT domain